MKTKTILLPILLFVLQEFAHAQKPELVLPEGHTNVVFSASYSPDGKLIVTASIDLTVKIWEASSGRFLRWVEGGDRAKISPDSKNVSTQTPFNHSIRVWDIQSGKLLTTLVGNDIGDFSYSPDGKKIVAALGDSVKLWDSKTGMPIRTLWSNSKGALRPAYSPNGEMITSAYRDHTLGVWDAQQGKLLNHLQLQKDRLDDLLFSLDSKQVIAVSKNQIRIWDLKTGNLLDSLDRRIGDQQNKSNSGVAKIWNPHAGMLLQLMNAENTDRFKFSPDGKMVAGISPDKMAIKIWDAQSGRLLNELKGHAHYVDELNFSPDSKFIVTASFDQTAKIWDVESGRLVLTLKGHIAFVYTGIFSPDSKSILMPSSDGSSKVWDAQNGGVSHILRGPIFDIGTSFFWYGLYSPDGKTIATTGGEVQTVHGNIFDKTARIWDAKTGKLLHNLEGHEGLVEDISYRQDSKTVVTVSADTISMPGDGVTDKYISRVWDTPTGKLLKTLDGRLINVGTYDKNIVTTSENDTVKIWDSRSFKLIQSLVGLKGASHYARYSPSGNSILTLSRDGIVTIWEVQTGKLLFSLVSNSYARPTYSRDGNTIISTDEKTCKIVDAKSGKLLYTLEDSWTAGYSPDGKSIVSGSFDHTAQIWDAENGRLIKTITPKLAVSGIDWNSKKILGRGSSGTSLFDMESGNQLLSWIVVDSSDWVVTHPSGLFDASPGAMEKLYFVSNLDIIELNQLKARYYEPGLWKKIVSGEKLRNVVGFDNVELYPDIRLGQVDSKGNLPIEVINRGGGIGEVTLYINGKEVARDLRVAGMDTKSQNVSLTYPVSANKNLIPGAENFIAVKAWNAGHWLESKGTLLKYLAPAKKEIKPAVHILVCGVSDYTGEEIDLKFAAKDAEDMARALELGANRLFGIDKSYVYTLTTAQKPDRYPTKSNILKTFEKVSTTASSGDVIVVYFSGHGINLGGADGDFYYLTQDAYTASAAAYSDPAIRQQATLSSQELVELFKKVPALKQVLMIDACASGKVVDNLMTKRDIESGTLRALDRMKDRTGMHIITGCTADAVSYEASRYGQGVLTYSLLEGLRGLALREEKFVDVNRLFQFAQERVPVLASGIGGIQTPQIFSPNGSQSFDFGELTIEDKKLIPIARERPVYIRSNFINDQKFKDVLSLGKKMDDKLDEAASRGESSPLLFTDVSEYPEGCQLSGRYRIEESKISLKLNRTCEGKEALFNVEAKDEKELMEKIMGLLSK